MKDNCSLNCSRHLDDGEDEIVDVEEENDVQEVEPTDGMLKDALKDLKDDELEEMYTAEELLL